MGILIGGKMIHSRLLQAACILLLLSAVACASGQAGCNGGPVITGRDAPQDIKILIVYQSKYGSTKQYAEWIRQDTGGDLVDGEGGETPDLVRYDVIIIGGYVRVGKIVAAPFIRDHWGVLRGKEVILFTTSGTPPRHPRIRLMYEKSLPEEIRKRITYFPLPGRMSGRDLTLFDRVLVAIGRIMEQDETLKKDMGKDFDGVQREHLLPLLRHLEAVKPSLGDAKRDR